MGNNVQWAERKSSRLTNSPPSMSTDEKPTTKSRRKHQRCCTMRMSISRPVIDGLFAVGGIVRHENYAVTIWRTITKEIEKAFVVYHFSSQLSSCSFVHSTASWCGSFLYFWWLQQSDSDFAHSVWCQNNQHDANRPLGQEKKETKVF